MDEMVQQDTVEIEGVELRLTCGACPEQYDAFKDGVQIGYLRLRHGYFYASVPDAGGKTVYESHHVEGDGIFEDDERRKFLTAAVRSLLDPTINLCPHCGKAIEDRGK
jgi:hypothetical protein